MEIKAAHQNNNDTDLTFDQLMSLPYLEAVCKETLRLHPPLSRLFRTTLQDAVVPLSKPLPNGATEIHVPAGTGIYISILNANRNPDIWGVDALDWKPERWLQDLPKSVTEAKVPGVYSHLMTFNAGGRSCIGFKFAQLEMKVVLAQLISSFEFALPEEKEVVWQYTEITSPLVKGEEDKRAQLPLQRITVETERTFGSHPGDAGPSCIRSQISDLTGSESITIRNAFLYPATFLYTAMAHWERRGSFSPFSLAMFDEQERAKKRAANLDLVQPPPKKPKKGDPESTYSICVWISLPPGTVDRATNQSFIQNFKVRNFKQNLESVAYIAALDMQLKLGLGHPVEQIQALCSVWRLYDPLKADASERKLLTSNDLSTLGERAISPGEELFIHSDFETSIHYIVTVPHISGSPNPRFHAPTDPRVFIPKRPYTDSQRAEFMHHGKLLQSYLLIQR
ncbi:hypothetical protein MPER_12047 [Moniliophthora perniciosa FA553]|nr:hypothetical protein MPER_12047 [Moniliophthora perniciosa FA553]